MTVSNHFAQEYLQHVLVGDKTNCLNIAKHYLSKNHSLTELYEEVIKEALYDVGRLWESNKISVATEHLATAITEGILNDLYYDNNFKVDQNRRVVLACVENEQHQVGIKMVADAFESYGWETFFLGSGIPTTELIRFIHETKPGILAISLSIYFNYLSLTLMLEKIRIDFPNLEIIIGGQAFNNISAELNSKFTQVKVIPNLYDLNQFINTKQ